MTPIDSTSNSTEAHSLPKRSPLENEPEPEPEEDQFEKEDEEFAKAFSGETKCKTKFWRCVARVVKGGVHYLDSEELSRYIYFVKNQMFY